MSKLVLYLADGSTLDIALDRERLTIGRRADNDVCLPYPAVSGEHAAVVTILSDSFLEDLGSTNGTLVNGKPIAKHFLRDRDQIDVGRQKFVYVVDDSAILDPGDKVLGRREAQLYGERVEAAWVPPKAVAVAAVAPPPPPPKDEVHFEIPAPGGAAMSDIDGFVAAEISAPRPRGGTNSLWLDPEPPHPEPEEPRGPVPSIRVLTGPNAGREVVLEKDETAVGRVGLQVAAVRRANGEFRLVPLEGGTPPSVNGSPVPAEGQSLKLGDVLEIAGVRLEFVRSSGAADG
jgi:hypothetical protein